MRISLLCSLLLLTGCASSSIRFKLLPDGGHQVTARTWAFLVKLDARDLQQDLQTEEFIAGTKAGMLRAAPDAESLRAITEAVAEGIVRGLKGF